MNFPMVALNVLAVFAILGMFACWFSALVAIHHRRMRSATWVPIFAGLLHAFWLWSRHGPEWMGMIFAFLTGFFGVSFFVAYVYGWARSAQFDEDEMSEGSGRFPPVMLVWTGCLLYVGVVALVNQAVTGTFTPVKVAGF